jgi:MFS family permease
MVAVLVVDRPEQMGQVPDGGATGPGPFVPNISADRHWHTAELLRNRNFWTIALPFSLAFSALSAILIHLIPYASDIGITGYYAAAIPSVAAGAGVLGKVMFGRMIDRMDSRYAIWASLGGQFIGVCLFLYGGGLAWLMVAAAIFGFSMGGVVPLHGAVTAEHFGRLSFGKAMGLLRPVQMPIHLLGVPLAGWIFDTTGSYDIAFQIFAAFYLAAIGFTFALRPATNGTSDDQARAA